MITVQQLGIQGEDDYQGLWYSVLVLFQLLLRSKLEESVQVMTLASFFFFFFGILSRTRKQYT